MENFKIENLVKVDKEKTEVEIENILNKKTEIKIAENKSPYQNKLDNNSENKLLFLIEKTKRKKN